MKKQLLPLLPLLFSCLILSAQENTKIDPDLAMELREHPGQFQSVILMLEDQVDLESMLLDFKKADTPIPVRQKTALKALRQKAASTQKPLMEWLQTMDGVEKGSVKGYWIVNGIRVSANAKAIYRMAEEASVNYITRPQIYEPADGQTETTHFAPPIPNGHEIGLEAIHAPALWKMGYTGYGKVAYIYDTGVEQFHPALQANWKYHNAPLDQAWLGREEKPYTCGDHGTHVAGTILGLDRERNDTVGVAFNAKFMNTANFNTCGDRAVNDVEAFQWVVDPDDDPNTVSDIPDALNMSGGRLNPGAGICNDGLMMSLNQAMRAANIAAIFAGGNEGPGERTQRSPAVLNYDLVHMFSVGNLDARDLNINNSSSHGPSICFSADSSLLIKPEISAPGTNVRSSVLNGNYSEFTGTSMAAPHTTGAYLLLKEAYPYLSEEEILLAMYFTARDLGDPGEDNVYGMGILDVLAAFIYLQDLGHTPVPPISADLDVVAVHASAESEILCKGQVLVNLTFENGGVDTLKTLDIIFSETTGQFAADTFKWDGLLLPDQLATIQIPISGSVPPGEHELLVQFANPNNRADARDLNNFFKTTFTVLDLDPIDAGLHLAFDNPVCQLANVLLSANNPLNDNQEYWWFSANNQRIPLAVGPQLLTSPARFPTTVFVDIFTKYQVGRTDNQSGTVFTDDVLEKGLVFDALTPLRINSVKVYATETGGRIINLYNKDGDRIGFKLVTIREIGESRLQLDIDVPKGEDYKLELAAGKSLSYNTNGSQFPYEVPGVISIKESYDATTTYRNRYFCFYDWDISAQHGCGRQEVSFDVSLTDTASMVDFEISSDTLFLSQGWTADFTDLSENPLSWSWDFGDGQISAEQSPSVTYNFPGTYRVSLTVLDSFGCTNSRQKVLTVIDEAVRIQELQEQQVPVVFPNPAKSSLYVQLPLAFAGEEFIQFEVIDLLGRTHFQMQGISGNQTQELSISRLPAGTYALLVRGTKELLRPVLFVKD